MLFLSVTFSEFNNILIFYIFIYHYLFILKALSANFDLDV